MSWKERFKQEFLLLMQNSGVPTFIYRKLENFIEALIKETEQRVLEDILKNKETMYKQGILATFVAYPHDVVRVYDIEQLREKYKGVE